MVAIVDHYSTTDGIKLKVNRINRRKIFERFLPIKSLLYTFDKCFGIFGGKFDLIMLCGDIDLNPGPKCNTGPIKASQFVKGPSVQSNLSIADMLYNGHLVIAETFLRNLPNHGQTLIEKPLHSGHFYSGHFF